MSRLTRAKALLARGLRRNLEQIRTILAEAADQADGIGMEPNGSDSAGTVAATAAHMWRLSRAVLAKAGGQPVGEFLLIPFGPVQVERPLAGRDFDFTPEQAASAVRWFESLGRKLAIDYEHQSFERHNTRTDGLRPAAGWIGGLQVRADGLWATNVSWTQRATELLAAGEYRYFSPVIFWTDEDYSDVAGLGPVALTNDPAMRGVTPLAAAQRGGCENAAVCAAGRNGAAAVDEALAADATDDGRVAREQLEEAQNEVAMLRRQLAAQDAEMFVERGLRLGKILDSTSLDWREDFLRDPARTEQRLTRAPVLRPPGRQIPERAGQLVRAREMTELQRQWGIEAEDLQAYEQAVAAGRVR